MIGSWNVNVSVGKMPQVVATAVSDLSETLIGAEYTPIAYLGSQLVNGINHAVLAEQLITTGRDTKNVVILIFNEKPNVTGATLVAIERIVESGAELGGIKVDVQTEMSEEVKKPFIDVYEGFVGSDIEIFALLGTQVTKGTNYIYIAETAPIVPKPEKQVELIIANPMTKEIAFVDVLTSKQDAASLGYAFTWLKR